MTEVNERKGRMSMRQFHIEDHESIPQVLARVRPTLAGSTYLVLSEVLLSPSPVSITEIRRLTGVSDNTLSSILRRLTNWGLIAPVQRGVYWLPEKLRFLHSVHPLESVTLEAHRSR